MPEDDAPLRLLKTCDPTRDGGGGAWWFPAVGWAVAPGGDGGGSPWGLPATAELHSPMVRDPVTDTESGGWDWNFGAFIAHFVTGLHDVYEHTFDALERHAYGECLLIVNYRVEEAARLLACDAATADQFLAYRTLSTRLPEPLLVWYACDFLAYEAECFLERMAPSPIWRGWRADVTADPRFRAAFVEAWPRRVDGWSAAQNAQYAGALEWPATVVPVCSVAPDMSEARLLVGGPPSRHPAMARLLDYALSCGLVPWGTLLAETPDAPRTLRLRPEGLAILRERMEADDPCGRIGTLDGGQSSDDALRWLLRARLENIVGPAELWAALGLIDPPRYEAGDWRLPLRPFFAPRQKTTWAATDGDPGTR